MSSGRNNKLAGQVGEFLVCAELGRRGLIATPFSGNVPTFDVLATDALCRTLPLQVKASRGDSWKSQATDWMCIAYEAPLRRQRLLGPQPLEHPDLIYVCVAIAKPGGRDRFFLMTKQELRDVCVTVYTTWMDRHAWSRPLNPESLDCRWRIPDIAQYEDRWSLVEDRLRAAPPSAALADTGAPTPADESRSNR